MAYTNLDSLFQPFRFKSLELKNRIVMAPMTRSHSPEGIPNEENAAYYRRRAEAEVGLILSEGTVIDRPLARNDPGVPFFHGEAPLRGWKHVLEGVHAAGGKMGAQIWHAGASPALDGTYPLSDLTPESPSGLVTPDKPVGKVMSEEDIADTINSFARAAADAKRLGFDMVEVHGAHGYLIDQFFWAGTNKRTDHYGGKTLKERSHLAVEVIRAVRAAVGQEFAISLRVSQWKVQDFTANTVGSPDEMAEWLVPLAEAGVDIFHCSQRRFWEAAFPEADGEDSLNLAGWAKKLTGAVTMSVGSVGLEHDIASLYAGVSSQPTSLEKLTRRLEAGEFDLIAVGRALMVDPQWLAKIHSGNTAQLKGFNPAEVAEYF